MSEFTQGRHEEAIRALGHRMSGVEDTIDRMDHKIDTLLSRDAERRGERKAIAFVATAAGGFGSLLISLVLKLWGNS